VEARLLLFSCLLAYSLSQAQTPSVQFKSVVSIDLVVDMVNAGDGSNRFFLVQQSGTIKVFNQAYQSLGDFLVVPDVNYDGGERGLLSIAFHPNYATNGYFYVYYTGGVNGDITLARFTRSAANPNVADPASRVILMQIPKPLKFDATHAPDPSHNGGKLNFGPDGYLYFATGDGGEGYDVYDNAMNGSTLLGKMLRIDVNVETAPYYRIPSDNPYVNDPNVRDEIWAMGLRNPWRWSFDKLTHDMWLPDVGQRDREEINFIPVGTAGGMNFGWHCYEGTIPTPTLPPCTPPAGYIGPIYDYMHNSSGGQAVVGGYVYRGTQFPSLQGYYFAGDYVSRNLFVVKLSGNSVQSVAVEHVLPSTIKTFGETEDGNIYIAGNDGIYQLQPAASLPVKLVSFTLRQDVGYNDINWKTASEINSKEYQIEFSFDGANFSQAGIVKASGGTNYSFKHRIGGDRKLFYRLKMIDIDGNFDYSKIISTNSNSKGEAMKIFPSITSGSSIQIELNRPFMSIQVFNMYGQLVHQESLANGKGIIFLETGNWKKGMYTVIANGQLEKATGKLVLQ